MIFKNFSLILIILLLAIASVYTENIVKRQTNACMYLNCLNGGTCIWYRNVATCQCASGWRGGRCESAGNSNNPPISISCTSLPCYNGGRCIQITSSTATCFCPVGYSGPNCLTQSQGSTSSSTFPSQNPCSSITCLNGGQCIQVSFNIGFCNCINGFTGQFCNIPPSVNLCQNLNCLNGAQCIQLTSNNAYCKCSVGFTGQRCETSINPATPSTTTTTTTTTIPLLIDACATGLVFCQNGATCVPVPPDTFRCDCRPGFFDILCDKTSPVGR